MSAALKKALAPFTYQETDSKWRKRLKLQLRTLGILHLSIYAVCIMALLMYYMSHWFIVFAAFFADPEVVDFITSIDI